MLGVGEYLGSLALLFDRLFTRLLCLLQRLLNSVSISDAHHLGLVDTPSPS